MGTTRPPYAIAARSPLPPSPPPPPQLCHGAPPPAPPANLCPVRHASVRPLRSPRDRGKGWCHPPCFSAIGYRRPRLLSVQKGGEGQGADFCDPPPPRETPRGAEPGDVTWAARGSGVEGASWPQLSSVALPRRSSEQAFAYRNPVLRQRFLRNRANTCDQTIAQCKGAF